MTIGESIRHHRKKLNLTQAQLLMEMDPENQYHSKALRKRIFSQLKVIRTLPKETE